MPNPIGSPTFSAAQFVRRPLCNSCRQTELLTAFAARERAQAAADIAAESTLARLCELHGIHSPKFQAFARYVLSLHSPIAA